MFLSDTDKVKFINPTERDSLWNSQFMINYDMCRYYTDVSLFPVDATARWECIETAAVETPLTTSSRPGMG